MRMSTSANGSKISSIMIVGGGSAGWLTAGILAARYGQTMSVTLVESPDVKIEFHTQVNVC